MSVDFSLIYLNLLHPVVTLGALLTVFSSSTGITAFFLAF